MSGKDLTFFHQAISAADDPHQHKMAESSSNPAFIVQGCCEPPSHLYAEYLPKLQKISIVVSLAIPSDSKTKVIIGKDANTLEVHHKTVTTRMALPVNSSIQEVHLGFANRGISPGQTKLTWRIEPANAVIKAAEAAARTGIEVMRVPWSAADLVTNVDVVCRKCEAVILGKDSLVEWRDLPSENWAEMMEFWHCHKPTTTNHDKKEKNLTNGHTNESIGSRKHSTTSNDELASRGYGANSAISARSGIGFVDLTKFLFFGKDCCGLTVSKALEWPPLFTRFHPSLNYQTGIKKVARREVFRFLPCLSASIQMPQIK